jgi:signal transduction histidine kinase
LQKGNQGMKQAAIIQEVIVKDFHQTKELILNRLFKYLTIILGIFVCYNTYRIWPDYTLFSYLTIIAVIALITSCMLLQKMSLQLKAHLLLIILTYLILYGLYDYGYFGNGRFMLIIIFSISIFYLRKTARILYPLFSVLAYLAFAILYDKEILTLSFNAHQMASSRILWISDLLFLLFIASFGGMALMKVFKSYQDQLKKHIASEQKLAKVLEGLPLPVAVIKPDKTITHSNKQFQQFFNYEKGEPSNVDAWINKFYPNPIERDEIKQKTYAGIDQAFINQKPRQLDFKISRPNGQIQYIEVHHAISDQEAICTFIDITEKKNQRRQMLETILQTEKNENDRVGKDLHDGIGPLLTTAKIYIHSLRNDDIAPSTKEEYLNRMDKIIDASLKEIKNIINNISPHILQQYGLVKAIESFTNNLTQVSNIHFNIESDSINLQSDIFEFALHRATTELINNSLKYSKAKHIHISFKQNSHQFILNYQDDGIGFDYKTGKTSGFGLRNVENRINNLGGEISYQTSVGNGVKVTIKLQVRTIEHGTNNSH